ncbi:hypothetical protein S7335_3915 [Synechococcus sp. PCC 7335]|nr:hypothetical protein S7335_3915 [Synechococcus sp. PCC 7335]
MIHVFAALATAQGLLIWLAHCTTDTLYYLCQSTPGDHRVCFQT